MTRPNSTRNIAGSSIPSSDGESCSSERFPINPTHTASQSSYCNRIPAGEHYIEKDGSQGRINAIANGTCSRHTLILTPQLIEFRHIRGTEGVYPWWS